MFFFSSVLPKGIEIGVQVMVNGFQYIGNGLGEIFPGVEKVSKLAMKFFS